ncbi:MAG: adenylate/guanylate cyclase domain-containing protein [Brevinematales bacterium]|nr:adenylate/guanylate cyclase domain-containing protein [Brevinematales bacterium]
MTQKMKNLLYIIIVSLIFTFIVVLFYYLPEKYDVIRIGKLLKRIENISLSMRFNTTAQSKSEFSRGWTSLKGGKGYYRLIRLVLLDNVSVSKFGSLNFDYDIWADLINHINNLEESKPKIAWFDINWKYEGKIDNFIKAVNNNSVIKGQNIILERFTEAEDKARHILPYDSKVALALKPFELKLDFIPELKAYQKINSSLPDILASFHLIGAGNIEMKNDIYDLAPMIIKVQYYQKEGNDYKIHNVFYPSSVLLATLKILDSDINNVVFLKNKIIIKNALYENKRINFEIPVDKNYCVNVNYRGRSKSGFLNTLSLKDLKRAGIPKDTILLFGIDIEGLTGNQWLSPLGNLNSTEHLAYALGTILNRDFLYEVPTSLNIIYIFVLVIIVSLLAGRKVSYTGISAIISIGLPLALGFGLFFMRIIILTFIPLISGVFTLTFGQIYLLLTEEREKKRIKATFSKYVSPEFVNILVENPELAKQGGVEKEVTMLFSDIRGFTTLSEGMSAKELIDFLNDYLSIMTNILMENKGTLDKYIGDAIVGFWGAPVDLEDHAYYACLSAVKMMKALKDFNARMEALGKNKINIGIGLNSGKIIVGNIGSEKKMNYTAVGDTAILTEELQDENKTYNTNIIISEFTYEKVKEYAQVRELGEYNAKHRDKPIKIYELLDIKEKV